MFARPLEIVVILLALEGLVLRLSEHRRRKALFKYLPSMFWIYFLPMLANTAGLLPESSPVYGVIRQHCLPACLVLLLLSVDLPAILRLGPAALTVMLAGSLGIILGAPAVLLMFKPWLPVFAKRRGWASGLCRPRGPGAAPT